MMSEVAEGDEAKLGKSKKALRAGLAMDLKWRRSVAEGRCPSNSGHVFPTPGDRSLLYT